MKINLEVEVSEAMSIAYALRELANHRREWALEQGMQWGLDSAEKLDALSARVKHEAYNQKAH